jgi:hypothetical protein
MTDIIVYILATVGAAYVGLTVLIMVPEIKRRREDRMWGEMTDFRSFVDEMRRLEREDDE